jgi:hypothetical protein
MMPPPSPPLHSQKHLPSPVQDDDDDDGSGWWDSRAQSLFLRANASERYHLSHDTQNSLSTSKKLLHKETISKNSQLKKKGRTYQTKQIWLKSLFFSPVCDKTLQDS